MAQLVGCHPYKAKGRHFDSPSEHKPGLYLWPVDRAWMRGKLLMFLFLINVSLSYQCFSHSFSPLFPLSKNNLLKNPQKTWIKTIIILYYIKLHLFDKKGKNFPVMLNTCFILIVPRSDLIF